MYEVMWGFLIIGGTIALIASLYYYITKSFGRPLTFADFFEAMLYSAPQAKEARARQQRLARGGFAGRGVMPEQDFEMEDRLGRRSGASGKRTF